MISAVEEPDFKLRDAAAEALKVGLDDWLSTLENGSVGMGDGLVDRPEVGALLAGPVGRGGGVVGAEGSMSPVDDVSAMLAPEATGTYSR